MKMFLIVEQLKYSDITKMKQQRIATYLSLFLNGQSALNAAVNVLTMLKDMIKFREIDLQMFFFKKKLEKPQMLSRAREDKCCISHSFTHIACNRHIK